MPKSDRIPLSDHLLYRGRDVGDAREVLSRLFTPVSVEPLKTGGPYSTSVCGLELPKSAICYCEYPNGMIAGPEAPLDFHTIQLTLSGSVRFDSQFGSDIGDGRSGIVLSAGNQMKVHHGTGNAVLSFIVKDLVLRDLISTWTGQGYTPPLRFHAKFDLSEPRSASVLSLLDTFIQEVGRPGGVLESPAALASVEQSLLTFMLFGLEHNLSDALRTPAPQAGEAQVKRVEAYIEAHAHEPIDMGTIVRVTGQSASSIYRAFRRHRRYSPMAFLREVRFRSTRHRLLQPRPGDSVSKIAHACGFAHLGRFAVSYKRRFGESPSETLNRVLRI